TIAVPENSLHRAEMSHATFHQNVRGLKKAFYITWEQPKGIVRACPDCNILQGPGLGVGV
ncbi:POK19 protein, partial [Chloroceryle aenea]|nr:POK19 protein [Chloroceryle aenea]